MPQPESDTGDRYDFAVFGSTPFALLLAGCLAGQHKRRVALIGERYSPLRLPQGLWLSAGPATRPETWAMLRRLEAETLSLLGKVGATSAVARQPVTFRADVPATASALAHMRHMAMGSGLKVGSPPTGGGLVIRNVAVIDESNLHPAIDVWLRGLGVERLEASVATLTLPRRGDATIAAGNRTIAAAQTILGDDSAVIAHLDAAQIPAPLALTEAMAVLTSPIRIAPPGPVVFADRRVMVSSRGKGLLAHVVGASSADARLASALEGELPLVRLATRRLRLLESADGAPLIGWLKDPKVFIAAGMGTSAPFLAPLVARAIADAVTTEDKAWLTSHDPSRIQTRAAVGEFVWGSAA